MQRYWFISMVTMLTIYVINIFFAAQVCAQQFEFSGKRKKETISFTSIKNLIIIPIYIDDKGPYNFLLDTGVGQMIITDTSFLKKINLEQSKTILIQGYGLGEGIEAILTRNVNARVGRSTIKNIPTAIFKSDIFDLSAYLGVKIYGLLGYYFFNSFLVKVNYSSNKLTYYKNDSKVKIKGTKLPLRIINAKPYLSATIQTSEGADIKIELLVDNGSSQPLMLESMNQQPFPLPLKTIPANLGVGINGEINGVMGRVNTLNIKDFTFNNVLTGFPEFSMKRSLQEGNTRNGTLGAEVLKNFHVTFDYKEEAIYLKKRRNFNYKFDHDMSGLEIYVEKTPKDRFYIGRVEPESPAERAGIQSGDEILSINLRGMEYYTLNNINELLKEYDGKQVIIEVQRKSQRLISILRLKKRI